MCEKLREELKFELNCSTAWCCHHSFCGFLTTGVCLSGAFSSREGGGGQTFPFMGLWRRFRERKSETIKLQVKAPAHTQAPEAGVASGPLTLQCLFPVFGGAGCIYRFCCSPQKQAGGACSLCFYRWGTWPHCDTAFGIIPAGGGVRHPDVGVGPPEPGAGLCVSADLLRVEHQRAGEWWGQTSLSP